MGKFKYISKNKISQLPKNLGVYALRKGREILYIGKAINIKERVKNHFQRPASPWEQTLLRQGFGGQVGYIKTDSEIEALILEANLIKRHQPKYNVVWRDDKNYFFVGITKEDFPQIFLTHQPKREVRNTKYEKTKKQVFRSSDFSLQTSLVGPFVNGKALKQTLKILRKVFPYRTCNPPAGGLPKKPCLWYQLNRCPAPCLLKPDKSSLLQSKRISARLQRNLKEISQKNAKNLITILQGKKKQVLNNLKKEMKKAANLRDFEKAAKIRDQIKSLEKVLQHAKISPTSILQSMEVKEEKIKALKQLKEILGLQKPPRRIEAYDISNIQGQEATGSMVTFIEGIPDKNFYRKFKIRISGKPNDTAMIKEILSRRFKHPEWPYPDLILIDGGKAQLNAGRQCLKPGFKQIGVMALAKKKNDLYLESRKKPIRLNSLPNSLKFVVLQLRDEAHRFAISYHRKLRAKSLIK